MNEGKVNTQTKVRHGIPMSEKDLAEYERTWILMEDPLGTKKKQKVKKKG